ncbi:MAG: cation-translocating P-type ATPase C-terminal domain-containing protein [Cytophagales bacterium]|nr:cation-translocating P-type ATPase C-terminal domain-containing protein [Cytophagales bacterium]
MLCSEPPHGKETNVFSGGVAMHILWVGLLIGALCLGIQAYAINQGITHWQTMVFTALSLCQLAHVIAIRSSDTFIYKHGFFKNRILLVAVIATIFLQLVIVYAPFMQSIFHTSSLSLVELLICFAVAAVVFHAVEIEKWIRQPK